MTLKIQNGHFFGKTPLSGFMGSSPVRKNLRLIVLTLLLIMAVFAQPGFAAKLGTMKGRIISAVSKEDLAELKMRELEKIKEERLFWGRMVASSNPSLSSVEIHRIGKAILKYSGEHGLPPGLIIAVIKVESSGRVSVVSPKGAQGLMQVMPFWKEELGIKGSLFDIDNNIKAGTHILSTYIKKYGYEEGIARYYRGSLKVDGQAYYDKVQKEMQA